MTGAEVLIALLAIVAVVGWIAFGVAQSQRRDVRERAVAAMARAATDRLHAIERARARTDDEAAAAFDRATGPR